MREAELTETQINQARDEYRGPPAVAARLWFIVADLAALDPMYQASLAAFQAMYQHSIMAAPSAPTLEARLQALVVFMTAYVHQMVCRGLFDAHKLVFAFIVAVTGQRDRGEVSEQEWEFMLRGSLAAGSKPNSSSNGSGSNTAGSSAQLQHQPEGSVATDLPALSRPSWCAAAVWAGLEALQTASPTAFKGLCQTITSSSNSSVTDANSRSSDAKGRPGTSGGMASWQQLMLQGSLQDFLGGSSHSSDAAAAGSGVMCLLDRLVQTAGIGQQQQHQQPEVQPQQRQHSFKHQPSTKSQNKLSLFQKLLLIKVSTCIRLISDARC